LDRQNREFPEFSYAKRRQRPEIDPAMRRMALAAGGLSVLVIAVAMVWSGVRPRMFGPVPEITAPETPLRVAPADPGGLTVPGANEQIMSGAASTTPQLAPAGPPPAITQFQQASGVQMVAPPPPSSPPAVAAAPSGPIEVQLAASADEAGVHGAWSQLNVKIPDLLRGQTPEFVPAVVNGQSIWRLRLGGFADAAAAQAFCAAVVAKGAACTVAAF
jgi:hypothetical protein